MSDRSPIPVAWSVRWLRIRQRILPITCFALAVWCCGLLWEYRGSAVHIVGEVEARRIIVTSPSGAVVTSFTKPNGNSWTTLDRIEAGDLLASLSPLSTADDGLRPKTIEIHSPVTGTIAEIHCTLGQIVASGDLMATITDDRASHVISYLPEKNRWKVEPGLAVTLSGRSSSAARIETQIESVGRQIELVPMHQIINPMTPQWGLPVRIQLPEDPTFRPGALVDVIFSTTPD